MTCPCCFGLFGCDVHFVVEECMDYAEYMVEVEAYERKWRLQE